MKETLGRPPIEKMSDKVLDGATIIFLKYFFKSQFGIFRLLRKTQRFLEKHLYDNGGSDDASITFSN